ncbi:MAG: poly(R)-hydroxyalkanoic acid synthase subunit PhaE, partial [Gammaproteobacteria bacterium]
LRRYAAWLRDDTQPAVASLRALYDAWVRMADTAYREAVMQEAFSEAFGAHVNAMSARRAAEQALTMRFADAAGLPHRGTLDALADRQATLQAEIAALRAELARLREARAATAATADRSPAAPAAAARSTAPRGKPAAPARPATRDTTARKPRAKRARDAAPAATDTARRPPARGSRDEFDIGHILGHGE